MKLKRSAVCALLSLVLSVQAAGFEAAAAPEAAPPPAAQVSVAAETADEETAPSFSGELPFSVSTIGAAGTVGAAGQQKEEEFLEKNPELAELGEYVFEDDSLPCSENDPSYHKYISSIMDIDGGYTASLVAAGAKLLSYVYNSENLVHQSRFDSCSKTYGIDVSYYQGSIDWNKVKAEGFTFAIIRVGFRGYGSAGTLVLDDRYYEYMNGAKAAGLNVGVYFYTQAITVAEAQAEADFVYKHIKSYSLELPVYFDIETVENAVGRLDGAGLSKAQKTANVLAFLDRMTSYGYAAGLYTNISWYTYWLNGDEIAQKYPVWLANYTMNTAFTGPFDIWQYGAGPVNGINGYADLNVRYINNVPPTQVKNVAVSGSVGDSVVLKWDAAAGCSNYDVFRETSSGDVLVATSRSTYVAVPLSAGLCDYYVKGYYTASNTKIYGKASESLKLKQNAPTYPRLLSCTSSNVRIEWDPVEGASEYYVQLYNESTGKFYSLARTSSANYNITGLSPMQKFRVRIRCIYVDAKGNRTAGNIGEEKTYASRAAAVTNLKYVTKTDNTITLSWDEYKGADEYRVVYYRSSTDSYVEAARSTVPKVTVKNLERGEIYFFKVCAICNSVSRPIYGCYSDGLLCATRCAAPGSLSYTSTASAATFTWTDSPGATGYYVYLAKDGETARVKADASGLSATVSGLDKGAYTAYVIPYIKLDGLRYFGNSTAKIPIVVGKAAPVLASKTVAAHSVTLKWNEAPGASEYQIYQLDEETGTYKRKAAVDSSRRSYTFVNLNASTDYSFKLRSYYPTGEARLSTAINVTTSAAPANDISRCTITYAQKSFTYCGKAVTPLPTIKNASGAALKKDTDYTVTYSNNLNVGTATVMVKGKGSYSGVYSTTFKITALNISTSNASAVIPSFRWQYTGSAIKPALTLSYKDGTVISSTQYTLTYTNNTAVGMATITVKPKTSNLTSTRTRTFVIMPARNKIAALTSTVSGKFRLTWTQCSPGATGYQVLYTKDPNFKNDIHTWTTTDTTKLAENFSSVPVSGETWYVKVRSYVEINGYRYGYYSPMQSVKVK